MQITQDFLDIKIKIISNSKVIQKDIEREAILPLDFSSRNKIVNLNILPRYLFLFQALPVEVTQCSLPLEQIDLGN